jgi:hypothetical protein
LIIHHSSPEPSTCVRPNSARDISGLNYKDLHPVDYWGLDHCKFIGTNFSAFSSAMNRIMHIQIPIQMNQPESERMTVLYGAQLALETGMGVVLVCYLDSGGSNDAVSSSIEAGNSWTDGSELSRRREEFIQNELIEIQGLVSRSMRQPPTVSYMIASNARPDASILEIGREGTGMYLLCGDNLETHSFSWIREINHLILNNREIPVLIHNPRRQFSQMRTVLYGINGGRLEEKYFRKLAALFNPERTEIIALYITEEVDSELLIKLNEELEGIKMKTGYFNMKLDTLVTRAQLNAFNLSNSIAVDRDADMIFCSGCELTDTDAGILPEEIRRQVSRTDIPFLIY